MTVRAHWTQTCVDEVADGVFRIPLPLPDAGLKAVNVYALSVGRAVVLVDAGWSGRASADALRSGLGRLGWAMADVARVLVTHSHGDHYAQAVDLRRSGGAHISLGEAERPSVRLMARSEHAVVEAQYAQLRACGADAVVEALRSAGHRARIPHDQWEDPDTWLAGEIRVGLEERPLLALPTPGHTAGHYVFVDEERSLLFAGDHVLPHITPSIGFEAVRNGRPLQDYLRSLALVRGMKDMLLLPAHGPPGSSVHRRVDELLAHHDQRLRDCAAVLPSGFSTAHDVAGRLAWTRHERPFEELDAYNQMLATLETAAHLDVLSQRGRVKQESRCGVMHYAPRTDHERKGSHG